MTNTAMIDTRTARSLVRLATVVGLVAALLLASQADTFARERDEQQEDRPRQEEPRDPSLEDDPADNGNSLEEDPADNGNSMTELELDPIVVNVLASKVLTSSQDRQSADLVKEEVAFAYKTIK